MCITLFLWWVTKCCHMSLMWKILSLLVVYVFTTILEILSYAASHWGLPAAAAAAVAKSLQSCPTLCDPIDSSPTGSPIPGILQARTLEWVAISFSNAWKWKVKVKLLSRVRLFATPSTAAYQAPPSLGYSRQEDWSGVPSQIFQILLLTLSCLLCRFLEFFGAHCKTLCLLWLNFILFQFSNFFVCCCCY